MEVRPGYRQTEVGVIPEDWVTGRLEDFFSFISYGFTNPMPTVNHGVYMITAADISGGEIRYDSARHTTEVAYRTLLTSKSKPKKNDVLLTKDGSLGRLALVGDEAICINQSVAVIRPNDKVDPVFLKLLLESPWYQRKMIEDAGGSTIKHIYITIVNLMPIAVPMPLPEQRAIAAALSDVDALLAKLDQFIAKKRDLKQAAMQQLLTGQIRLPGFSGEWEVKRLGDVVEIRKGQLITEKDAVEGDIPVIAGGKKPSYFHNSPNRTGKTITVSASGASAGYVAFFDTPIFASDCSTISDDSQYSIEFIYFQLLLKQGVIYKAQTGGAQPHIHAVDLIPLEIGLCSVAEQTAIATVLSDMDTEIKALEARRHKTRALKQGMMQELLTGRIRLV